jgi:D-glycero-D-manno-heptose 1,7-bisphosphate phosphatase
MIKRSFTAFGTAKAVFWDRDGVLNHVIEEREDGLKHVSPQKLEDFKIVEGAAETLNQTKALGYLNIIATNQSDISRNKISWEELNRMHDFLKIHVPTIDAIYVCPHTAEENCNCRKPKPGLLVDAAKDYHLDLSQCYMVGDTQKDIDAAKNAGVKSILFRTHYNQDVKDYDFEVDTLKEILKII